MKKTKRYHKNNIDKLMDFVPLYVNDKQEFEFLSHYQKSIKICLENKLYQNAYIDCHILFMYVLYTYMIRIRNKDSQKFYLCIFCVNDDIKKGWINSNSPFVFSSYNERSIFNFLRLINLNEKLINKYKRIVDYRNALLHASGKIMKNEFSEFDNHLYDLIECLENINSKIEDETCLFIYTNFLNEYGQSNLNLKDEDEINEYIINNLIRPNNLSYIDMKKISQIKYKDYVGFVYKKRFKNLILFINKKYGRDLKIIRYVTAE